jgi:hypothetical protein
MFSLPSNKSTVGSVGVALVFTTLISCVFLSSQSTGHSNSIQNEMTITIRGRVLAKIDLVSHGAGLGPHWSKFIFALDESDEHKRPIEIAFAYFGRTGLSDNFFDYSKVYELKAKREVSCDESVGSLSIIKNVTESGRELPPTNALHLLEGAPNDFLRPEMILPCYIVIQGNVRTVEGKQ